MIFDDIDGYYHYRVLHSIADEKKAQKKVNEFRKEFSVLAKEWSPERNSQWICRIYFCTKMILNATMILKQAKFAEEKNLRAAIPYFHYYAMLSITRCVVLTLPTEDWNHGDIFSISHKTARDKTREWLARYDRRVASRFDDLFLTLKSNRELISYKAPASADRNISNPCELIHFCTLLAEVAQINTAILHKSVMKYASEGAFVVFDYDIARISEIKIEGKYFHDSEDSYRLDYLRRKSNRPHSIYMSMTEGQTEDFIGAWNSDIDDIDNEESLFYSGIPSSWQDIFNIP